LYIFDSSDREIDRQTDRQTDRRIDISGRQTDSFDRQHFRQADRNISDRQIDRQIKYMDR